jgi:hypothetical protein
MDHNVYTYDENGDIKQPKYCVRLIDGNEYICRYVSQDDCKLLTPELSQSFRGMLGIVLPPIILFALLVLFAPRPYGHPIAALILSVFLLIVIAALNYDAWRSQNRERDQMRRMSNQVIPIALLHAPKIDVDVKVSNFYN